MNLASSPIEAVSSAAFWAVSGAGPLDEHRGVIDAAPSRKPSDLTASRHPSVGDVLMTWMKTRPEVFEQMVGDGLSPMAILAHLQGIAYVYRTERMDCRIARTLIPKILFANPDPARDVAELVRADYWSEHATHFELVDHRNTIRESLTAQHKKRDRDVTFQQKRRARKSAEPDVADDVANDAATTQSNNQTTNHAVREGSHLKAVGQCRTCDYGDPPTPDGRCQHCVDWDVKEIAS